LKLSPTFMGFPLRYITHLHPNIGYMGLIIIGVLIPIITYSQPPNRVPSTTTKEVDTLHYQYFHIDDVFNSIHSNDTLVDMRMLQKVGLWNSQQHYVNTGNYGSVLMPLIFSPEANMGFNVGMERYHLYQVTADSFRFYAPNTPVSDLFFSQLGTQNNLMAHADFSRGFTNGVSMSLNYKRLSYGGQYQGQDTKSTGFGIALRYESDNKRHNSIFFFSQNANEEGHHGGVLDDADVQNNPFRRSVPIQLRDASSRQQQQNYAWHQYYRLNAKSETSSSFYVLNILKFQPSYYKFSDREVDSTQHQNFYAATDWDRRGIRRYLDISHWSEGLFIHAEKEQGISGRVGLTYDNFKILDGGTQVNRNDLTASFDGYIPVFKTLFLNTKARLGLLENVGNFDLSGRLDIKLSDWIVLSGNLHLFMSEPSYIAQNLIVNNQRAVQNEFNKTLGTVLSAEFAIPKIKLKVGFSQTLMDQLVYFNAEGLPQQSNSIHNLSLIYASHKLKWGLLGFDNQVFIQNQPTKLLPIPDVFSSHQLYFMGKWFKKVLDVNIGIDVRSINEYNGPAFNPLFMNFHLSDQRLNNVPAVHAFFMAKVDRFRALIMMDNVSQYFLNPTNYHVVGHPQLDPLLRISIRWLMLD